MPYADPVNQSLPFQSGSETSHDAAVQAKEFAGRQQRAYFDWLRDRGEQGGTDAEAEAALHMKRSSICARRNEFTAAGKVVKTDQRRNGCAVWRVA